MTTDELRAKFDPSPLTSGPTKWRAEKCTTHHYACDCREWEHACQIERLEAEVEALKKDAERYRWLRDAEPTKRWNDAIDTLDRESGHEVDAAIDAAMREESK